MRIIQTADLTPESMQRMSPDDLEWVYNGLDCCVTMEVLHAVLPQLDDTTRVTYERSLALQAPVMEMSVRGLLVDQGRRYEILRRYERRTEQLEAQLDEIVRDGIGTTTNWRSPLQLRNLLYDVMGLPPVRKRNARGIMAPTVNREALEKLQTYWIAEPLVLHLLALRDLGKKRGFLETGIDADGRMRSSFNIAGTTTGRLSSSESEFGTGTNQQNIDRELRSIFIADPGWKFLNIDLEQADSRNLGGMCWNTFYAERGEDFAGAYLNACESGDLHTTVCKMARPNLPWTGDRAEDRKIADTKYYRNDSYRDLDKKLGHGSNYLGTPPTMAKHAKVPLLEVKTFQSNYFKAFPEIPAFHAWVISELKRSSTLYNILGRRRTFFGRDSDASTHREAVAYCGQSSTAEEINIGMLQIWRAHRIPILLQVHDSLLMMYPEEIEEEIVPWALDTILVRQILAGGREFVVPAEAKIGWNYGDYNDDPSRGEINLDGLKKWKGGDDRVRERRDTRLSIRGL